ncbi:MAG: roadblock/LC7 domain-containing protein, partial [Chitinispirillaceae bacterium]|nr:roadblock/LC7 domain-containing protein [Chitinispirillaceae bacterium]
IIGGEDIEESLVSLPALINGRKNEKRFFFSMTEKRWLVISAFTLMSIPCFTIITLDITNKDSSLLRPALFKLSDYFTVQCRKLLQGYVDDISLQNERQLEQFGYEKTVFEKIKNFSSEVQCVVLLDEDGFIIHTEGYNEAAVDELGGVLARLFYRSNSEIARLELAECNTITISDVEYTIMIGRIPGTTLAIAISIRGPHAAAYTHFLYTIGLNVLCNYAKNTGKLWGVPVVTQPSPTRIRKSWFGAPYLIPKGRFVSKKGGQTFHTPQCPILSRTDTSLLDWFENRALAIQSGLRPCGTCNP